MASTKEYLDFVMEQLSGLDEVSSRAMMGEYILYYRGRIFGGVYDDRLLVKPVPMALRLMPDAEMEQPYHGAKEMILVDNVDDRQFLCELVESMWCYPAFYLVLNHTTFNQIKKRHSINYSDGFYIGLLYAVPLVLS